MAALAAHASGADRRGAPASAAGCGEDLRADRAAYQREQAKAAGLLPDVNGSTGFVVTDWHFVGREYPPSLPLTGGAA